MMITDESGHLRALDPRLSFQRPTTEQFSLKLNRYIYMQKLQGELKSTTI